MSVGFFSPAQGSAPDAGRAFTAPTYTLVIAGRELQTDITRFVEQVEYEHADGIAEMAKLTVANPGGMFTDSRLFQPLNELEVYGGYGTQEFLGRVQLVKPLYRFPKDGLPTMEITGYSRDHSMMDHTPKGKGKPPIKRRAGQTKRGIGPNDRVFKNTSLLRMVNVKAASYGFDIDCPDDFDLKGFTRFGSVIQKATMSDYQLLRGVANMLGWYFWVDYSKDRSNWVIHMRKPNDLGLLPGSQTKQYTFQYNMNERTTLFSFEPEMAVRDSKTNLYVEWFDGVKGQTLRADVSDEGDLADNDASGPPRDIEAAPKSGATVKLFWGDYSFEVMTLKRFKNPAALAAWAKQWFRRHRENFIMGRGETIGVETVRARQIHTLKGLGVMLDGDYFFARVRHVFSKDEGYKIDFNARKVVYS